MSRSTIRLCALERETFRIKTPRFETWPDTMPGLDKKRLLDTYDVSDRPALCAAPTMRSERNQV